MNAWIDVHSALLLCVLGSVLVTQLPKVLPVTFLRGDCLPALLRHWLSFVPVAVMARPWWGRTFSSTKGVSTRARQISS